MRVDISGNLFVADTMNQQVSQVVNVPYPYSGEVVTVAGTGVAGTTGDGEPATLALISGPSALALDASANCYFAESGGSYRVRLVTASTGIITLFAGTGTGGDGDGGAATLADIRNPIDLALDSARGVLYITTSQFKIRAVSLSTGIISTVAGTGLGGYSGDVGPATLTTVNSPYMALDGGGNMFFSDGSLGVVRYLHHSTGIITTIAGTGTRGTTGDGGPAALAAFNRPGKLALDAASGRLYISDSFFGSNSVVRVVSMTFPCPAGSWSPTGSTPCTACAANTYSTSTSTGATTSSVCTCAANTYSTNTGAESSPSCGPCGVLMASAAGATSCSSLLGNIGMFAGRHYPGTSGDGGAATSAFIGEVWDVLSDVARGRVFILDQSIDNYNALGFNKIR
jgi:hypothetical protein